MSLSVLQQGPVEQVSGSVPGLVGAGIAVLVGVLLGGRLGTATRLFLSRTGVAAAVTETPLGRVIEEDREVDRAVGVAVKYYVYLVAVLVAADLLGLSAFTDWVADALRFVPALVGGVAVVAVGLFAADYAADVAAESETPLGTPLGGAAVRAVLYFLVVAVGLDTAGANLRVVEAAVGAVSEALVIAVAIVVGLAVGLGKTDEVVTSVEEFLDREDSG